MEKKGDNSLGFADLALEGSLKYNRSLKLIQKLEAAIGWSRVQQILMAHYAIGDSIRWNLLITVFE